MVWIGLGVVVELAVISFLLMGAATSLARIADAVEVWKDRYQGRKKGKEVSHGSDIHV